MYLVALLCCSHAAIRVILASVSDEDFHLRSQLDSDRDQKRISSAAVARQVNDKGKRHDDCLTATKSSVLGARRAAAVRKVLEEDIATNKERVGTSQGGHNNVDFSSTRDSRP